MLIIGVDLGTANSPAAVLRGGRPVMIPSAEGLNGCGIWPTVSRSAEPHINAELQSAERERFCDVVANVAHEDNGHVGEMLVGKLPHCHKIGEGLRRVCFVGKAIVNGHARIGCELAGIFMRKTAKLDCVIDATEDPSSVLD